MSKCCECGKLVFFWNRSKISFSAIHRKCHARVLSDLREKCPEMNLLMSDELVAFSAATGISVDYLG